LVLGSSQAFSSDKEVESNFPLAGDQETKKNIEIVNVKKCKEGLGIGFADGLETAVATEGLYIRFLLPENTWKKVSISFALQMISIF